MDLLLFEHRFTLAGIQAEVFSGAEHGSGVRETMPGPRSLPCGDLDMALYVSKLQFLQ